MDHQCLARLLSPGEWVAHVLVTNIIILAIFAREEDLSPSTTLAPAPHFYFVVCWFSPTFSLAERHPPFK